MIEELDQKTKERVNKAIGNIRLIATRVKRANILDAVQKAEMVVNVLNAFRMYINLSNSGNDQAGKVGYFRHDQETLQRVVQATMQADDVYNMLPRNKKKSYEQEHRQVWSLLENIHAYLTGVIQKGG